MTTAVDCFANDKDNINNSIITMNHSILPSVVLRRQRNCMHVVLCVLVLVCVSPLDANEPTQPSPELKAKISKLIKDLGATEFQVREAAESELASMGLTAYEALLGVQNHQDIEIRLRARHIVDMMRGDFMMAGLPEELVPLLRDYHKKRLAQRAMAITELEKLLPQQGAAGLARIVRFEVDERLSRAASLPLLAVPLNRSRTAFVDEISAGIGFSQRTAVRWLRAYAETRRAVQPRHRTMAATD